MARDEELIQKAKEVREGLIAMAAEEIDATHIEVGAITAVDAGNSLVTIMVGGANRLVPFTGHDVSEFVVGEYWAVIFDDDYGTIRLGWWVCAAGGGGVRPITPHVLDPALGPHTGTLPEATVVFADAGGHIHSGAGNTGTKITAANVINVPAGGIAATDVQAAINELDTEKAGIGDAETISADWLWGTDKKIQFRDAAIYIHSAADGYLDLVADTAIRLDGTTLHIDAVNDRVGIGTATPGVGMTYPAKLHDTGSANTHLMLGLFQNTNAGTLATANFVVANDATGPGEAIHYGLAFRVYSTGYTASGVHLPNSAAVDIGDYLTNGLRISTVVGDIRLMPVWTTGGNVVPYGAGLSNLGTATAYWADVSYKTLTDRGCLFDANGGVEMTDGRVLSDMEALLAIKTYKDKLSIQGLPALDYATMPKAVYSPAPIVDGKKEGDDGAELTALISIMLGGMKELHHRLAVLEEYRRIK